MWPSYVCHSQQMLLERLRTTLHKEINLTSTPERALFCSASQARFRGKSSKFAGSCHQQCPSTPTLRPEKSSLSFSPFKRIRKTHTFFPATKSKGYTALVPMAFSHDSMELDANCGTQMDPNGTSFRPQYWSYANYPNLSIWGGQSFWVISLLKYQPRNLSG